MSKQDYYQTLGLQKNSSDAEIKKAYRKLAMKYHPDRNPDDKTSETKFKEAKEAYEVLSDNQKRAAYDQFGHAGVNNQAGMGGGFNPGDSFNDIFGDMFGDIFGNARGQRRQSSAQRGADLRYELDLDLEQAVFGETIKINIPSLVGCETCVGSGAKKGTQPTRCSRCEGRGSVRVQQGFFTLQQTCPDCRGAGQTIKDPCVDCSGSGRVQKERTISIKIPPGVDQDDRIRLSNEGEAGMKGGPAGDLYVDVNIRSHPIFKREGSNLFCEVPISFTKAALGGTVEVPTIDGAVNLTIPTETQSGEVFRLRGKGVQSYRDRVLGDLFCNIQIETPVNLNADQKNILKSFEESINKSKKEHRPNKNKWTESVKNFFNRVGL
jgi:molecular chaperone DnaJ